MNGTQRVRPGERVKAHLVPMTGGDDAAAVDEKETAKRANS
ncbi:hypothetical protein BSIN_5397 [Burkholderia singularis]|uniref:Uncharacterized protein n=1 Tax=Burkholderia singularis TaxID=1503053 RepID=A0A238GYQ1_9BURK|nr:hypothetical protein BSIN_5397 [Burkholderia singularis]